MSRTSRLCQTFEARPYVKLGKQRDVCGRTWRVKVMDPYGNSFATDVMVDCTKVHKLKMNFSKREKERGGR